MWNLSTCDCKYNKACKTNEYLDIESCSCKKTSVSYFRNSIFVVLNTNHNKINYSSNTTLAIN